MPQGKRRSAVDIFEQGQQRQGQRKPSAVDIFEQGRAAPSLPSPQPEQGALDSFTTELAGGLLRYGIKPATALGDAINQAINAGNLEPLKNIAESAGRGVLNIASAFDPAGNAYEPTVAEQAPRMAELKQAQEARLPENLRLAERGYNIESAKPRTKAGKAAGVVGGIVGGAAPAVITGVLTGGSLPAIATTAGLQSLAEPENLALNVGASVVPVPVGKLVAPILRRIRGAKGAEAAASEAAIAAPESALPASLPGKAVAEAEATASLPVRRPVTELPEIYAEPDKPIKVSLGKERTSKPGAVGPRIDEYGFVESSNPGVVTPAERDSVWKTLTSLFKAGLLTKPNTHLKNLGGNAGFALSEEASRIPAAIADMVVSPIFGSGRRTITGPSAGAIGRSSYEAATKGVKEAWEIIKKGPTAAELEQLGLQELNSGSKVIDTYVNGVFRLLNAEDKIFKTYAVRRAIEDRAKSVALTEIRAGTIPRGQYGQRVKELIDQPPESLAAAAIADAEVATFTNENLVSGAVGAARQYLQTTNLRGGKAVDHALELVLPFVKTPTNVVARMLEYSGITGGPKLIYALAKGIVNKGMTEAEQRAFSQTFGRSSIGTGLIALGALLYKKGLMTGFREDDPTRKARDEAAGRTPGSILIGDTWHQVVGFAPVGNLMAIGATIQRESNQERDDALKAFLEAGVQAVGEQPLLMGAKEVAGTLREPGSFVDKTLGGLAAGFVPGAASDVAQFFDDNRRKTDTLYSRVANRIPGLRNTLPEKPDVLGRSVALPFPVNPFKSTTAQQATNPLMAELTRLDQGISGFEKKKTETDQEYADKVNAFGQLYQQYGLSLINSPAYQNQSDVAKQEIFDLFNQRLKTLITENQERFANAKLSPPALLQAFRESQLRKLQKRNSR